MAWNLARVIRSKSTWMVGFLGVIPVWLLKLAPNTSRQSDSFMSQLAMGVPLRPSTPPASGWPSEICPFALNVVMNRCLELLGQGHHRFHLEARAVADNDDRAFARAQQIHCGLEGICRRGDVARRQTSLGTTGARSTLASHSPVSRLVAPGPAMARQAAGRSVCRRRSRQRRRRPRGGCHSR